jgi:hypothetical protein
MFTTTIATGLRRERSNEGSHGRGELDRADRMRDCRPPLNKKLQARGAWSFIDRSALKEIGSLSDLTNLAAS